MEEINQSVDIISKKLGLNRAGVRNTIQLLEDGATVPFISRYRKEKTGSLDELSIADIKNELISIKEIIKRKETIIKSISEQNSLTKELQSKIENCWDRTILEDIYLPFKKKVKTKATVARESGLEPLANVITEQKEPNIFNVANNFTNEKVPTAEDALQGARYIIAEQINENPKIRETVRLMFERYAMIETKVVKKKKTEAEKYKNYFEFSERLESTPSHRLLAMYRGAKEGFLKMKISIDNERAENKINNYLIRNFNSQSGLQISLATKDCLKRLLLPSIELEFKNQAKLKADKEAIEVFQTNLKNLLLNPPLGEKVILAIDPGFRTGCKTVVLDRNGMLIHDDVIYPNPPQNQYEESKSKISYLVKKYNIDAVAIGNGTAGKETIRMVKSLPIANELEIFFVNESGASIYSASKVAREEFPDKDVTVRGAVSIGRRLLDPMAELVKIDPKSIGVGQYQHDVNQTLLKEKLDETIVSCVNSVGVNLNTASKHLLTHISGLGPVVAQNIVNYRGEIQSFKQIKELLKVPKLGKKAFEQCAGFLRIKDGKNPLDNTAVHPESYSIVKSMAKDLSISVDAMINNQELSDSIDLQKYVTDTIGIPTLKDIVKELSQIGLDPRGEAKNVQFKEGINTINDLSIGLILPGIVNNVTKFGAFVDIGIKESGLVHISELANRFVKDPSEVVAVNQEVKVKVIDINAEQKKVALSIKQV